MIDPETGTQRFETNAVTIRKLPEAEFSGRDHRLFGRFPLWFSFESTAGLLFRSAPVSGRHAPLQVSNQPVHEPCAFMPHLTTAVHVGPLHIVPSIGVVETFYGEAQMRADGINRVLGTNIVQRARFLGRSLRCPRSPASSTRRRSSETSSST